MEPRPASSRMSYRSSEDMVMKHTQPDAAVLSALSPAAGGPDQWPTRRFPFDSASAQEFQSGGPRTSSTTDPVFESKIEAHRLLIQPSIQAYDWQVQFSP